MLSPYDHELATATENTLWQLFFPPSIRRYFCLFLFSFCLLFWMQILLWPYWVHPLVFIFEGLHCCQAFLHSFFFFRLARSLKHLSLNL